MNEEYVNGEITRKLIDKGCPVKKVFVSDCRPILYELPKSDPNWFKCKAWYIPTIAQVLNWLRKEKSLHIALHAHEVGWCFDITDMNSNDKFIYWSECEYQKFEQAALAGINYVLNNLI